VTRDLGQAKLANSKPNVIYSEPEPELDASDEAILLAVSE
jgi:hypothetical protein